MTFQHIRMILGFFVGYTTLRFGIPIFFTWLIGASSVQGMQPAPGEQLLTGLVLS